MQAQDGPAAISEFSTEHVVATHVVPGVIPLQVIALAALVAVSAEYPPLQTQVGPGAMSEFDTEQVAATHVPGDDPIQVTMLEALEAVFAA